MVAVETSLEPLEVLDELKRIEKVLGRQVRQRNGPREIDLDLILYGSLSVQTERLTVPHPRAHERDFVMVPMADVAARLGDASPEVKMMLSKGEALSARSSSCVEHMFCGPRNKKTMVMGVVNATPDSFSDGGQDAASVARRIVESGADVIDVGGESTRPGAEPVPPDQEIDRVVPLIETLCRDFPDLIVSIDTRRASVAEAATSVGASVVNDISGAADQDMLKVVANTSAAYVASHCRGNPQTMQTLTDYDDLIRDVSFELSDVVSRAKAAGIAPWRLIVDPGIGFAKNHQQNIALLRHLPDIKRNLDDLPLLVGPSRKGFIGTITNEPRADRYTPFDEVL